MITVKLTPSTKTTLKAHNTDSNYYGFATSMFHVPGVAVLRVSLCSDIERQPMRLFVPLPTLLSPPFATHLPTCKERRNKHAWTPDFVCDQHEPCIFVTGEEIGNKTFQECNIKEKTIVTIGNALLCISYTKVSWVCYLASCSSPSTLKYHFPAPGCLRQNIKGSSWR